MITSGLVTVTANRNITGINQEGDLMNFLWTTIAVKDMNKSLKFYQEIVSLPLKNRMTLNPGMELAFLGSGETQIELIWNEKLKDVNNGSDISLGFQVDSIDKMMEFLKSKNIPIQSGPFQPGPSLKIIFVLDPNGLKIQFVEKIS
jgi:lactoylglutathione lyase